MIVDSSALVALVLAEPGWERLVEKLERSSVTGIGCPTLVETNLVYRLTARTPLRT